MAVGFAMAQQMAQGLNQPQGTGAAVAGAPAAAAPNGDVLTPAQVAQRLGVTEQDGIASIDAGDLKGKKIGTQYRVTKAALDEFLEAQVARAKEEGGVPFPDWLYDRSVVTYAARLISWQAIEHAFQRISIGLGRRWRAGGDPLVDQDKRRVPTGPNPLHNR
jgi:excisionase family DNA binding protein